MRRVDREVAATATQHHFDRLKKIYEGEEETLAQLLDWCRKGPPFAVVTAVDEEYSAPRDDMSGFSISY